MGAWHPQGASESLPIAEHKPMGLFKPDLYRSFAIGFAMGAVLLGATMGLRSANIADQMIPTAQAAPALVDQTR